MNTELFIARRLFSDRENKHHLSRRIINIALAGIALGIILMLLAVAIVTGFKKEISDKVIGFGGHIQVVNFDSNLSYETTPVSSDQPFFPRLEKISNINSWYRYATKPGIIKTEENIQGVVLKGVDGSFDWKFFSDNLIRGEIPMLNGERSPQVLISENLSTLLMLKLNDPLYMYFVNENEQIPRIRQFTISGIYRTNLQEFDNLFVLGDIRQVQHINGWDSTQVSGFEFTIHRFDELEETTRHVRETVISYNNDPGSTLRTLHIRQKYPQIFDWLSILDMNVWVILTLMVLVAGFNMISALLVLILERSRMIGTLKALGSHNSSIRKIFLYLSGFLVSRGLLWGNLAGIALLLIQKYLQPFSLDPASYYMEYVPVHLSLAGIVMLNAGALAVTLLMLVLPGYYVSRISPGKTLQFD
jgi:lipoprotein-releasing system permease protein